MNGENVFDALREMATDNGTSGKEVTKMMAAVVADMAETQKEFITAQKPINKNVENNSKTLARYNKGVWLLGGAGAIWGIERLLALVFGG